jgi:hypothetical protein
MKKKVQKIRNPIAYCLAKRTGGGSGKHRNRVHDIRKGSSRKLKHKALMIFASLLFAAAPAASDTFIDQTDGGSALVCSDNSGRWVCKPVSVETLLELGWIGVEGVVFIEETVTVVTKK